jgi:ABC-type nitrate/sulfonate/bicarbonate transport system permease component
MNRLRNSVIGRHVNLAGLAVIVLVALVWQLYSATIGSGFDSISTVPEIWQGFLSLLTDGDLIAQLFYTAGVALLGWVLAALLGAVVGMLVGLSGRMRLFTMSSLDILRAIPAVSFVPVVLLIFGFSFTTELVIAVYASQWPVLLAAAAGVMAVPSEYLDVARTMRLSRVGRLVKVIVPSALPSIVVGMRLALALSVSMVVVVEILGNPSGLGFGIAFAQISFKPPQVYAYLIVIGLLGWALNALFVGISGKLVPATRAGER